MQAIISKSRETYETIQGETAAVNGVAIGNWQLACHLNVTSD